MPAGQVIGRIAVRVLPDTSGFKEEAKRQLDRIEQQLRITIGTKIDTTGARRGVLEAVRDINRDNRATDSRKIRFYTTIATDGMRTAVEKAARELQHRANSRKVSFQVDDLKATGKVQLELDQQSADRVKQKLKDWADDISPLKVTVEPDIANGSGAALGARLQALTRPRTVPIVPELDNAAVAKVGSALAALSGARVLTNVFEDLGNVIRNLDKSVPVIGSLALAIAGLAGWGLSAASNLAALSASLAQMGLAAAAMPALFAGIGIGLGVTVMAFKDMRKVLPDVYAEFGKMHKQVSADFWHEAAQPIRDLAMTFLPHLADSASQVGKFWGSLATELNKPFKTALDPMFANLSKSIEIATGGTKNFAGIITSLGLTGSEYLPQLAQWFVGLTARFDAFLGKAAADGTLKGWIDKGIENIKALGSVLYNLGGIFAGIARAAEEAGGSSLGMLAGTLERIHRTVDSSGFQEGLIDVFKGAHEAMNPIVSESGPAVSSLFSTLAQLAADVLPQVGRIIGTALGAIAAGLNQSGVMEGVRALFDGLQAAVEALAPAMAPLGVALGALMSLIGSFAAHLGPLVAAALIPLAEAFSQLTPVIEPLIGLLGGALTQILTALTPLFLMLVEAITPLIEQLVAGLAPIIPVIVAAFTTMVQAVMPVVDILLQLLTAVITPLLPLIQSLAAEFLPQIAQAFARVMEAVQPLLEALLAVVNFLMPVLAPAIEFVASLLLDSLVSAINGVADVFTGVIDTIRGVWNIFAGIFTGDWGRVWNGVKQLFSGVCNTIKGLFNVVMNVGILGVAGKALKGVKALWTTIWTGIKTFATGIWNALRGGAGVFILGVKGFIDDGLNALKGRWESGWTLSDRSAPRRGTASRTAYARASPRPSRSSRNCPARRSPRWEASAPRCSTRVRS